MKQVAIALHEAARLLDERLSTGIPVGHVVTSRDRGALELLLEHILAQRDELNRLHALDTRVIAMPPSRGVGLRLVQTPRYGGLA